jgi:signal transduction histidine kinase
MTWRARAPIFRSVPLPADIKRMRYMGMTILAGFAIGIATDSHHPGLHGRGLVISIAFAGYLTAVAIGWTFGALRGGVRHHLDGPPGWKRAIPLALLAVSSAVLFRFQSGGYGVVGIYTVASVAGLRFRRASGYVLVGIALVAYDVALITGDQHNSVFDVLTNDLGLVMLYLVTRLAGRAREDKDRAETLLAELEESRDAEARAVALNERGRIAREMHDVLAHSLSALAVQLEGARLLARDRGADPLLVDTIEKAHHLAAGGLDEARRAIDALRGEDLPGPGRLAGLVESFGQQAGIETTFDVSGHARELSSEARLALYRTAQEALTNVRKHAHPDRVDLRLRYGEEGTSLVVEDHGSSNGFDAAAAAPGSLAASGGGYGLSGMRERAELLGGRLVAAATDDGFRVELWLPA